MPVAGIDVAGVMQLVPSKVPDEQESACVPVAGELPPVTQFEPLTLPPLGHVYV